MYNKFNPRSNEYILYINVYMYSCETGALGNTCFTVHRLYLDYLQKYKVERSVEWIHYYLVLCNNMLVSLQRIIYRAICQYNRRNAKHIMRDMSARNATSFKCTVI